MADELRVTIRLDDLLSGNAKKAAQAIRDAGLSAEEAASLMRRLDVEASKVTGVLRGLRSAGAGAIAPVAPQVRSATTSFMGLNRGIMNSVSTLRTLRVVSYSTLGLLAVGFYVGEWERLTEWIGKAALNLNDFNGYLREEQTLAVAASDAALAAGGDVTAALITIAEKSKTAQEYQASELKTRHDFAVKGAHDQGKQNDALKEYMGLLTERSQIERTADQLAAEAQSGGITLADERVVRNEAALEAINKTIKANQFSALTNEQLAAKQKEFDKLTEEDKKREQQTMLALDVSKLKSADKVSKGSIKAVETQTREAERLAREEQEFQFRARMGVYRFNDRQSENEVAKMDAIARQKFSKLQAQMEEQKKIREADIRSQEAVAVAGARGGAAGARGASPEARAAAETDAETKIYQARITGIKEIGAAEGTAQKIIDDQLTTLAAEHEAKLSEIKARGVAERGRLEQQAADRIRTKQDRETAEIQRALMTRHGLYNLFATTVDSLMLRMVQSEMAGLAKGTAFQIGQDEKAKLSSAKVAAANAWKALSGIPVVGPALGAAAAAATFTAIMAFEKGGVVAQTGIALVHRGETVLPERITNFIMGPSAPAARAAMHLNYTANVQALDSDGVGDVLGRHGDHLAASLERHLRGRNLV